MHCPKIRFGYTLTYEGLTRKELAASVQQCGFDRFESAKAALLVQDEDYENMRQFWSWYPRADLVRDTMIRTIEQSAQSGELRLNADTMMRQFRCSEQELSLVLSTYRQLAKGQGYVMAPFLFDESTNSWTTRFRKANSGNLPAFNLKVYQALKRYLFEERKRSGVSVNLPLSFGEILNRPGQKITIEADGDMAELTAGSRGELWVRGKGQNNTVAILDNTIQGEQITPLFESMRLLSPNDKIIVGNRILVVKPDMKLDLYSNNATMLKQLFPKGIAYESFQQNNIGDCYLLSSLDALAKNPMGEAVLARMIQAGKNGGWEVEFPDGEMIEVTPQDLRRYWLSDQQEYRMPVRGCLGWQILERAFGKRLKSQDADGGQVKNHHTLLALENAYKHTNGRYDFGHRVLHEMTGWQKYFVRTPKEDQLHLDHQPYAKDDFFRILDQIGSRPESFVATANTPSYRHARFHIPNPNGRTRYFMDAQGQFMTSHVYSIRRIDPATKTVTLVNPWDTSKPIGLSYEDFYDMFASISYVEVPTHEMVLK